MKTLFVSVVIALMGLLSVCTPASAQTATPTAAPTTAPAITHRFLKSGCNSGSVAIVSADGQIEWEYKIADETNDSWLLPNGDIVFAHKFGVREVTPDKQIVWEYKAPKDAEVHSCQPLPGDRFLIGEARKDVGYLYEMDRGGKIHKTITIPSTGGAHSQFRVVRKTPQNTYLVTYQRNGGKAMEFDGDGKLLRTFPGGRFAAIRLPDGNTLIAGGDEHRIIEVDPKDNIVWEVNQNDIPGNMIGFAAGMQRLPNGNTVICNWSGHGGSKDQPQVFEITRDKRLVWELKDKRLNMISSIQILDVVGELLR